MTHGPSASPIDSCLAYMPARGFRLDLTLLFSRCPAVSSPAAALRQLCSDDPPLCPDALYWRSLLDDALAASGSQHYFFCPFPARNDLYATPHLVTRACTHPVTQAHAGLHFSRCEKIHPFYSRCAFVCTRRGEGAQQEPSSMDRPWCFAECEDGVERGSRRCQ